VRRDYADVYRELRARRLHRRSASSTTSGSRRDVRRRGRCGGGVELVLLHVAYARGGIERFRQESVAAYLRELETLRSDGVRVGVAPHSVRACPRDWLEELGRYAAEHGLPLHVHADEQPREIEECLAEHGLRPIELLDACGCLGPRTTVVHATHADGHELDLLAAAARASAPARRPRRTSATASSRSSGSSTEASGSASARTRTCASIPLEELRELDGIARRQSGRRDVFAVDDLLAIGAVGGASA
jgi:formimidoylglutamate deiminase